MRKLLELPGVRLQVRSPLDMYRSASNSKCRNQYSTNKTSGALGKSLPGVAALRKHLLLAVTQIVVSFMVSMTLNQESRKGESAKAQGYARHAWLGSDCLCCFNMILL